MAPAPTSGVGERCGHRWRCNVKPPWEDAAAGAICLRRPGCVIVFFRDDDFMLVDFGWMLIAPSEGAVDIYAPNRQCINLLGDSFVTLCCVL